MTDAEWCGRLSQAIRTALTEMPAEHHAVRGLRRVLDDYDQNSGFPPPDAQLIANVGHDMPAEYLKPGQRLINGNIYYSARWLQDGQKEVPGAYRYVIFLNPSKTMMLTCWPQEEVDVWKVDSASRAYTEGTWGPPTSQMFRGTSETLERWASTRGYPVKELVL